MLLLTAVSHLPCLASYG